MICLFDDGIVAGGQKDVCDGEDRDWRGLRDRPGESGTRELSEFVERHSEAVRADVVNICTGRVRGASTEMTDRLADVKTELAAAIGNVKVDLTDRLAEMRVELLRWSFLFWIGQVAALFAAMAMFAEWLRP